MIQTSLFNRFPWIFWYSPQKKIVKLMVKRTGFPWFFGFSMVFPWFSLAKPGAFTPGLVALPHRLRRVLPAVGVNAGALELAAAGCEGLFHTCGRETRTERCLGF